MVGRVVSNLNCNTSLVLYKAATVNHLLCKFGIMVNTMALYLVLLQNNTTTTTTNYGMLCLVHFLSRGLNKNIRISELSIIVVLWYYLCSRCDINKNSTFHFLIQAFRSFDKNGMDFDKNEIKHSHIYFLPSLLNFISFKICINSFH